MGRTERLRKCGENRWSKSKIKGHQRWKSTTQHHILRHASGEPLRKLVTQVRKKQISLFTRCGIKQTSLFTLWDQRTISLGITRVRKCRRPGKLVRVSVSTPDFRVKKHEEDSWVPRAREGYEEESLGFFMVRRK